MQSFPIKLVIRVSCEVSIRARFGRQFKANGDQLVAQPSARMVCKYGRKDRIVAVGVGDGIAIGANDR